MNYAVRPTSLSDVDNIIRQLVDDVGLKLRRLRAGAHSLRLNILERHPDYPKETTKYLGTGRCVTHKILISFASLMTGDALDRLSEECCKSLRSRIVTDPAAKAADPQNMILLEDIRGAGIVLSSLKPISSRVTSEANSLLKWMGKSNPNAVGVDPQTKGERGPKKRPRDDHDNAEGGGLPIEISSSSSLSPVGYSSKKRATIPTHEVEETDDVLSVGSSSSSASWSSQQVDSDDLDLDDADVLTADAVEEVFPDSEKASPLQRAVAQALADNDEPYARCLVRMEMARLLEANDIEGVVCLSENKMFRALLHV